MGKRQFTRVGFRMVAIVTWAEDTIHGEVENISLHGIFIKNAVVPAGSCAEITIRLSSLQPEILINVEAKAVRTSDEGTAFEFSRIDVDSFIHLRKIVSYASSDGDTIMGEFTTYVDHKHHNQEEPVE